MKKIRNEFENAVIHGIFMSQYVAAWSNAGGYFVDDLIEDDFINHFKDWLRTLVINGEKLTEDEVHRIWRYATNGKLELEESAEKYYAKVHFKNDN